MFILHKKKLRLSKLTCLPNVRQKGLTEPNQICLILKAVTPWPKGIRRYKREPKEDIFILHMHVCASKM